MTTATLGETIRKYRRKKDITQEELAGLLYLTPQAISRWETNVTSPDTAILPKLAYIFGCTTDELLGVENFNQQEKFDAYFKKTYALGTEGKGTEVLALWRQALEEMPGNCRVMYELATQLRYMVWCDSSDEAKKSWEEARDLY